MEQNNNHGCQIARMQLVGDGGDWWIGTLVEGEKEPKLEVV
jgi:hypothetical protein